MDEKLMQKTADKFLTDIEEEAKRTNQLDDKRVYGRTEIAFRSRGLSRAIADVRSLVTVQINEIILNAAQMKKLETALVESIIVRDRGYNVDPEHYELVGINVSTILAVSAYLNSLK